MLDGDAGWRSAFCYACQAILARHLAATESTLSMSVYVVTGPLLFSAALLNDRSWATPDVSGWSLLIAAGLCSVVAWVGLINGYKSAPTALLAPFEYTALVGGAIAGYLIWDEVPDRSVVIGAMIIVSTGVFLVSDVSQRRQAQGRQSVTAKPAARSLLDRRNRSQVR